MSKPTAREIWFLTGSQGLYGEETLRQVASQSQAIAEALDAAPEIPRPGRLEAGADRRGRDQAAVPRRRRRMTRASAWSRGCTRSARRRCGSPGLDALGKPLLHLHTQANVELPWATIDMDFMNLNQAAHGDREFGYIQTRLGMRAQDGRRARVATRG